MALGICPKCVGGQVYEEAVPGWDFTLRVCLQCGWRNYTEVKAGLEAMVMPAWGEGGKEQVMRLRQEGEPEALVAEMFGLTPRTVRRWCQLGYRRNDGNRSRRIIFEKTNSGLS